MTKNDVMQKILSNLMAEFDKINEMWVYTKDMESALQTDDEHSFGLLLDMRKKLMDAVDVLNAENTQITSELSEEEKESIERLLSEKDPEAKFATALETDIFAAKKRIVKLLQKLIEYNAQVETILTSKRK